MFRHISLIVLLFVVFTAVMISGCQSPQEAEAEKLIVKKYTAGRSVQNRPINYTELGTGADVVLVLATIHGDEFAGTPIVNRMIKFLGFKPELLDGKKVVMMPVVNPDGFALKQRFNANGVDLNRNFQADNRLNNPQNGLSAYSEPESRIIRDLIEFYKPNRIIVYHQPLSCIDYDGPGGEIATAMGEYCSLPVKKLGSRPGSLGAYAGETLGIPTITVELTKHDGMQSGDSLWNRYHRSLLVGMLYPDIPADF